LGSGSVGLYRSICEESGRSLEAVTPQTLQVAQSERDHLAKEEVSNPIHQAASGACTALMIQDAAGPERRNRKWFIHGKNPELECANREMSGELDRTRMHLEDSLSEKKELQAEILRLQGEIGSISSRASHLEDELFRVTGGDERGNAGVADPSDAGGKRVKT
jgi:hypothetical protein